MPDVPLYFRYWGKAKPEGEEGPAYHLLPYHCLDVAAVAMSWWRQSKHLRQQFTESLQLQDQALAFSWVMFFVALHDLGKLDIRFQCKDWQTAVQLQPDIVENVSPKNLDADYFHGESGYGWFLYEWDQHGFLDAEPAIQWMKEVAGHHGVIPVERQNKQQLRGVSPLLIERDRLARRDWIDALSQLFEVDLAEIPETVPPMLAGFCRASLKIQRLPIH